MEVENKWSEDNATVPIKVATGTAYICLIGK